MKKPPAKKSRGSTRMKELGLTQVSVYLHWSTVKFLDAQRKKAGLSRAAMAAHCVRIGLHAAAQK